MKKLIKVLSFVAAFSIVMAFSAMAFPITGGISFAGFATLDNSDFTKATSFTPIYSIAIGTGSYSSFFLENVDIAHFTFDPEGADTPFMLWTYTTADNLITYNFVATGLKIDYRDKNSIVLSGTGMADITGFDSTPGSWVISANDIGGVLPSFSATINTVPVPPSLIILGSGLIGLVGLRRKIKK